MVTVRKVRGKWWCMGPFWRPACDDKNFGIGKTRVEAMVAYANRVLAKETGHEEGVH